MECEDGRKDPLALPSLETLREIERKQNERAKEIRDKRLRERAPDERSNAAQIIQRNYRGHRERRTMKGYGLDPSTRWLEALKDAHYSNITKPVSVAGPGATEAPKSFKQSRERWAYASAVTARAGSDDTSGSEDDPESQAKKRAEKAEREKYARVMGLQYFLEMVDQKHRYGSNLRRYHKEWMGSDTKQNFFYWLDYGEGKDLDLEDRPRKRLDTEQVRYLSREERKDYLVRIDSQGRFVWDKDGQPITTSTDFRDSIHGIVPKTNETPTWREVTTGEKPEPAPTDPRPDSRSTQSSGSIGAGSQDDSSKYVNDELHDAKGLSKVHHVSVDNLMNHLLRKTTKLNTWIFVADTSFRLYVGIKQSGAFQHSSFLKGARVTAAGLMKIKHGQIRQLSPLSGHYAPPVRNFREFIKNLKLAGADLDRLNISRSYAVILGLEGYVKVKTKTKNVKKSVMDVLNPEARRKREEAERDKSESAEKERRVLESEERERREGSLRKRVWRKVGVGEGEGGVDRAEVRGKEEGSGGDVVK